MSKTRDPRSDPVADAVARHGRAKGNAFVETALAARRLRTVSAPDGGQIVPERDYLVHREIVDLIGYRGAAWTARLPDRTGLWFAQHRPRLDPRQRAAFEGFPKHGTVIVHGGAGTGKTAVMAAIADYLLQTEPKRRIIVSAFSARIAMATAARCKAEGFTTHALTGTKPGTDTYGGRTIPENVGAIILIDEAFASTPEMLLRILRLTPRSTRIGFFGDQGQILPIGQGRALHDLLAHNAIPNYQLLTSHRLGPRSHLSSQRDRILSGLPPLPGPGLRIIVNRENEGDRKGRASAVLAAKLFKASRANGYTCVVLAPTRFGFSGHIAINTLISGKPRPGEGDEVIAEAAHPSGAWKNGERAIVVRYRYPAMTMAFEDGREVEADANDPTIALGYAMSGHRGQGLEYERSIVILDNAGRRLLTRQYLVSALTRAPDCVAIAEPGLLEYAISKDDLRHRPPILKSILDEQSH